ncbi:MAG: VOC family protein [Solirubrobacterales bacterium]|nr:VOC family protein [Solirubrobacterales bacterium]
MIKIGSAQLWVRDQDEAREFWTAKVGFEVKVDVTMDELGGFRWLTVGPPGDDGTSVVLMAIPGEPVMDAETKAQVEELTAKGFAGTIFLQTEDCQATYDELKGRGVEFTAPPEETPYGIDCGFTDPSGNHCRLGQIKREYIG